eukprot:CAMPEP_0185280566 /NCGR_PEP_ID=MMETSP1359-20130426/66207_1 /TAXON_ID=552665 /ORGANISM="Bigelowiella longifila, Strain CCMP242" /LENGTH=110 /DNA_ID=CAMNT_0027875849 /DNA_START=1307 /DNA_END=1639 /DNA_ORIENTATION=+
MGQKAPKQEKKESSSLETTDDKTYYLKKRRSGCTGMFWRQDPTKTHKLASNDNWPRDGAALKGKVVESGGGKWLGTSHVKQVNGSSWVEAPVGSALPFEYDNHYYLDDKP